MFVAVYWWRVKPGKEEQFRTAWVRGSKAIRDKFGSRGARLHLAADGRFIVYAQWPDEAAWRRAREQHFDYDDPENRRLFAEPVEESGILLTMTVTDDLLQPFKAAS
jgi:heme-degrading monooxygenase HmoA